MNKKNKYGDEAEILNEITLLEDEVTETKVEDEKKSDSKINYIKAYGYLVNIPNTNENIICSSDNLYYPDMYVVVPGKFGLELGIIRRILNEKNSCRQIYSNEPQKISMDDSIPKISHVASKEEKERYKQHLIDENRYLKICRDIVEKRKMELKVVDCHLLLHERKLIVFFTSDKRIDFRDLVKELVSVLKMRLELRKISEREETRQLGGLGFCGREFCCHGIGMNKEPITIQMAKNQNISINTSKISGPCEKLLCCLSYEDEFYVKERLDYPVEGTDIYIGQEKYRVSEVNVLSGSITVSAEDLASISIPKKNFFYSDKNKKWEVSLEFQKKYL